MNEDDRPDPEEILESIKREESRRNKGKLKIFLGMAAGVGKTFAMLEAAQKLQKEGVYVVVGAIDTHGREETAKLLDGLQIIPEKWIKYKDSVFEELDIDAILKCKPQLVLVDELAHSNVPGSRHPKRWQDVIELLDNGIDVYTTLNVQHIESLKDVIEKVTGITIRETVPDLVIDKATSIELLDLSPDELLRRLSEGKVYLGDQSIIAAKNFFQEDKLTALRQIVLRYAAEKVEHDLQEMVSTIERPEGWKLRERLLVAVSHSPHSQKLIRITRRLAFNLDAPWIAVNVDTGKALSKLDEETLAKNIALARDLGAEVITTTGPDIAQAIQRVARQKSVTQIIIGRPPHRWFLDRFQSNTIMDHLAKECADIDLHVIRQTIYKKSNGKRWRWPSLKDPISSYLLVTGWVILLSLLSWFSLSFIDYKVIGFVFLLGILALSLFFRKGPIFLASILYAIIWVTFFLPSQDFGMASLDDIILLAFYLLTAVFTGILTDRSRIHKEMLEKREKSLEILYDIVRDISNASTLDEALFIVKNGLSSTLGGHCEIVRKELDKGLVFDDTVHFAKNEKEKAAALWVFQNAKEAGWSTSTLPFASNLYIPLKGQKEIVGVLAYQPETKKELSVEEKNFLYAISQQLAHFLERALSEERARKYEEHKQTEKTYHSILNLISELFEGPLVTIEDTVKELKTMDNQKLSSDIFQPIDRISSSAQSLSRILENISAMVNLRAGITPVSRNLNDLKGLISVCAENIQKSIGGHKWNIVVDEHLPLIPFDIDLIGLLLYNLVFHAMEFSLPDSMIEISAKQIGDYVEISVSGDGLSIPSEMQDVAFEKFYRAPESIPSGLGLGMAIANTIAVIHNGELKIKSRPKGGMIFSLYLPVS